MLSLGRRHSGGGGCYAEKVAVPTGQVLPILSSVSLQDAASFPEVACTVWSTIFMMSKLSFRYMEEALVELVPLPFKWLSALGSKFSSQQEVRKNFAACKELWADVCINYKTEDFVTRIKEETGGEGVDVILDNIGGPYLQRNLDSLNVDGRLFIIGFMGGKMTEVNLGCYQDA